MRNVDPIAEKLRRRNISVRKRKREKRMSVSNIIFRMR